MHRPWYYTHVFACPKHADTVYVTNFQMWKSTDGGTQFKEITTPHGDNHDLWIDPVNPRRMVEGNDGGACVSFNGGERSEEHTSELQSLMRISYAVFCLKKKNEQYIDNQNT